jgi:outer membrane protein TolC
MDAAPIFSGSPDINYTLRQARELPAPEVLDIQECVARSILVSIPKEIGEKRLSLSKWNMAKAIRDLFPEVAFKFNLESGSLSGPKYRDRDYNFELKQPLFHGFTLVNTVLQENFNRKASRAEIEKAIQQAVFDALSYYFAFNKANEIYKNHVVYAKDAERLASQTEERKEKGLISEIEYLAVQSKYADILEIKELLYSDREIAALDLKKTLRLPPQETIDIEPVYDYSAYQLDRITVFGKTASREAGEAKLTDARTLDDFIVLAYKNRPDLKMEYNKLMANRYAEKATKGGWLPQSDMIMKLGQVRQGYIGADQTGQDYPPFDFNRDYSLGIVTSWNVGGNTLKHEYNNVQAAPTVTQFQGAEGSTKVANTFTAQLLNGLKQFADVRQAQLQVLEQLNIYDETERAAIKEVVEAFYKYRSTLVKLQSASAGLNYYKRSLDLAKLKLDKNDIQISEYMESLQDLIERRDQFHNAMGDYFIAKAQLNHAVGIENFIPFQEILNSETQKRS